MNKNKKRQWNQHGQASLVVLLILAIGFIFYAVELNWSRIADSKITTWIAANNAASASASQFASYGERTLQETLLNPEAMENWDSVEYNKGNVLACQETLFWLKIVVAIVVIVIAILAPYVAGWAVVIMTVLFAASLILEHAVINPMVLSMWNKLQQNMEPPDQFRETGIQTGLQALVTDNVSLPDRFDLNTNGVWGLTPIPIVVQPAPGQTSTTAKDSINRFSLYYTERLKSLGKQEFRYSTDYTTFRDILNALIITPGQPINAPPAGLGFNPYCLTAETGIVTYTNVLTAVGNDPDVASAIMDVLVTKRWGIRVGSDIRLNLNLNFNDPVTYSRLLADFEEAELEDGVPLVVPLFNDALSKTVGSPICNPSCTHILSQEKHNLNLGWKYGNSTNPGEKYYVPDECTPCKAGEPCPAFQYKTIAPPATNPIANTDPENFRLLYDPYSEKPLTAPITDPTRNSFRARLGHDDEMGKDNGALNRPMEDNYNKKNSVIDDPDSGTLAQRSTGVVFPMLEDMNVLIAKPDITLNIRNALLTNLASTPFVLSPINPANLAGIPLYPDAITKLPVLAPITSCAADSSVAMDSQTNIFWKRGSDRYCSAAVGNPAYQVYDAKGAPPGYLTEFEYDKKVFGNQVFLQKTDDPVPVEVSAYHWPYHDCKYMRNASNGSRLFCGNAGTDAKLWPQDRLDSLVYGLPKLYQLNDYLQSLSTQQFNFGIKQWYPEVAKYIAPKCSPDACTTMFATSPYKPDCNINYSFPNLDNEPTLVQPLRTAFEDNPNVCTPQQEGYMLQWWYDMQNWHKHLKTWLYDVKPAVDPVEHACPGSLPVNEAYLYPISSEGVIPVLPAQGTKPNGMVACLYAKSMFTDDLKACYDWFETTVPATTGPFPNLPLKCKQIVWQGQEEDRGLANGTRAFGNFVKTARIKLDPLLVPPVDPTNNYAAVYSTSIPLAPTSSAKYAAIKTWVYYNYWVQSTIKTRYVALTNVSSQAVAAMNLFKEGANAFEKFLAPPTNPKKVGTNAYDLMKSRADHAADEEGQIKINSKLKKLPGFAIYGWKDNVTKVVNGVKTTGRWHIARMEVKTSGAEGDEDGKIEATDKPPKLAKIFAFKRGNIFNEENCYEFQDGQGLVNVRATRWDEPSGGATARFNNKVNIWTFNYSKPNIDNNSVPWNAKCASQDWATVRNNPRLFLDTYCGILNTNKSYPGLTRDMQCALGLSGVACTIAPVSACNSSGQSCVFPVKETGTPGNPEVGGEYERYSEVFMFNEDPTTSSEVGTTFENRRLCWCVANALLSQGVMSYASTKFYVPPDEGPKDDVLHLQVRFNSPDEAKKLFRDYGVDNGDTLTDEKELKP